MDNGFKEPPRQTYFGFEKHITAIPFIGIVHPARIPGLLQIVRVTPIVAILQSRKGLHYEVGFSVDEYTNDYTDDPAARGDFIKSYQILYKPARQPHLLICYRTMVLLNSLNEILQSTVPFVYRHLVEYAVRGAPQVFVPEDMQLRRRSKLPTPKEIVWVMKRRPMRAEIQKAGFIIDHDLEAPI